MNLEYNIAECSGNIMALGTFSVSEFLVVRIPTTARIIDYAEYTMLRFKGGGGHLLSDLV